MLRIILAVILTSTCFACKKSSGDQCKPEHEDFKFQNSLNIDTVRLFTQDPSLELFSYTLTAGNKIVFTYTHQFRDCPEIADDEGFKIVVFEIPQQSDSFLFNDSMELRSAKCLIHFSCFCAPGAPVLITHGFIEGTKISANSWHLKASLQMPWDPLSTISFDNSFTLK